MPRDQMTKGCSMCAFGARPCVTPQACSNPHAFRDEDDLTEIIGRLLILLFALLLLIIWWRAA